ncbi:MAG TPA: hypothetical protein ENK52_03190, partial [Saprospiraceae bacterium]|nr:hypothetical protein [Saprospiraceae bacterium]
IGIYHPDYAQYSLGFYTMLLEIKWSLANDKKYYYPGYVIPGRPRFDYKLRIGDVEYYDPKDQHWKDWNKFDLNQLPINLLNNKFKTLSQFLNQAGIPHQKIFYPLFEEELIEYQGKRFIKFPILLSCYHKNENLFPLILEYDLMKGCYRLSHCIVIDNHISVYTSDLASRYGCDLCCLSFLYEATCLLETNNFEEIKKEILIHK